MKRFLGALACISVGFDCVERAQGAAPQAIFSDGAVWLWWVIAIGWMVNAIGLVFSVMEDY